MGVCVCWGVGGAIYFGLSLEEPFILLVICLFVCLFVYEPFILPHGDTCRGEIGLFLPRNTLRLRFRGSVTFSWRRKIGRWWDGSKGQ